MEVDTRPYRVDESWALRDWMDIPIRVTGVETIEARIPRPLPIAFEPQPCVGLKIRGDGFRPETFLNHCLADAMRVGVLGIESFESCWMSMRERVHQRRCASICNRCDSESSKQGDPW